MNTDYKILGLEQGASQAEIKKAYFKMVRLHSPESDPEKFQEIRQAYERLKNIKNKPEGPVFPPLSDPWAVKMLQQIHVYQKEKNMRLYRDACQEAWQRFPNDLQFLYLLIMAQRRCNNTGKAVKNAELLVSKDPTNKWFQMVLAFSYKDRGFTQKAFTAAKKAYELGCRDIDFLIMYANSCDDYYDYEQGVIVLYDIVRQDRRWTREDIPNLMEAFFGLIAMEQNCSEDRLYEILDRLLQFLKQYSIYVKEYLNPLCLHIAQKCTDIDYSSKEYGIIEEIFSFSLQACGDEEEKEDIHVCLEYYHFQCVKADERIGELLLSYLEQFHHFEFYADEDDGMMEKFYMTDLQLCMLEQRKDILAQAAILKQFHPQEYKNVADFIEKLENEPKIRYIKDSLLKQYRRLEPFFSNGRYYELYPQEKHYAMGTLVNDGYESEPYVRSTKKIGRNDPCPCGSGKKYKHCCMNK